MLQRGNQVHSHDQVAGEVYTAPAATKHHCSAGGDGVCRTCSYLSSRVLVTRSYSPQLSSAQLRGPSGAEMGTFEIRNSPVLTHGSAHKRPERWRPAYHKVGGSLGSAVWGTTLDEELNCLQADLQSSAGSGNVAVPLEQHWQVVQGKYKLSADSFLRVITSCRLDSAGLARKGERCTVKFQVKFQRTLTQLQAHTHMQGRYRLSGYRAGEMTDRRQADCLKPNNYI